MTKRAMMLILIGLCVTGMASFAVWAGDEHEEEVTLDQVPPAVKATILKESAGGQITEIERETENGTTVYEAEFLLDGEKVEITVAADGTLIEKEAETQESKPEEQERKVTEAEVPAAALAALRRLAGDAQITEFAEEVEHGHTFYEGSWKAPLGGNVDGLVTATGDLVEIEERVNADQVPTGVLAAAREMGGKDARLGFEKKTMILYEVKFRKNNRFHEVLLTSDGRQVREEVERGRDENDDDSGHEDEGGDD
jgi:uncharacterized membrane protein YkoI